MDTAHKIYIVEDQGVTRSAIRAILEDASFCISGDSATAEKAWLELQEKPTDLVLIDFGLKGSKNGAWLAEKINKTLKIPFIYLTAYGSKEFLEKIMKTKPAGYIMKPYNKPTLLSNIKIIIDNQTQQDECNTNPNGVFLKTKSGLVRFSPQSIFYLQSDKNYISIHCFESVYQIREKLEVLLDQLNFECLYRIHRRFAVNARFISKIEKDKVFINGMPIPMTNSYQVEELVQKCSDGVK